MNTFVILATLVSLAYASYPHGGYHRGGYGGYGGYRGGYGRPYGGYYYKLCPKLIAPAYGSVELSGRKPGSKATYTCNEGFTLEGEDTRKCQKNGEWSGKAPTCEIVVCPDPDPADPNGSVHVGATTYLSTAVYSCNVGYLLDTSKGGSQVVRCQADGTWSDTAPGCLPIDCGHLPNPKNGKVQFVPNTLLGGEARFTCKRGFELVGTSVRICEATGWSLDSPTCRKINCPKLTAPKFGKVRVSGTCVDDKALYRCAYGFQLEGAKRRVCQEDGSWSDSDPKCTKRKPYYGGYGGYGGYSSHGRPYGG